MRVGDGSRVRAKDVEPTRKWRKTIEQVEAKGFIAAVGMIATGVIGLVWATIKSKAGP